MAEGIPRVTFDGPLDLELSNGSSVRIRPGPRGKGIAIVDVREYAHDAGLDGSGRPGRKPRESTIRLRERLRRDLADGGLRENPHYVRWLQSIDGRVSLAVARQTVYRERKRLPQAAPDSHNA